jgi:hypothetical protein
LAPLLLMMQVGGGILEGETKGLGIDFLMKRRMNG